MSKAKITINKSYETSEIDPRIYGSFIEHLGRAIYGGIYQPGHPSADEHGFREDVIELVRELNVPLVRYPGGNFVSGYNWEDGVGPLEARPKRLDLAWGTIEPNTIGTNEFMLWAKKAGVEPMMAVNLGTRGADEARNLVEYCNRPSGTYFSDLRISHGAKEPHGIKLWCLGNEVDGNWQMGHKTAREYGRVALEAGKLMKWTDPTIELVACGSSGYGMPTFAAWDAEVLEETYETADYISMHQYYGKNKMSTPDFLAQTMDMEEYIRRTVAACDYVGAKKKSRKKINISFDEWNVWKTGVENELLREIYTMEDAALVGSMLISLIRHSDRVKVACQAQLVNVIAPILTEKTETGAAIRQSIFYPYLHASLFGRGISLLTLVECDKYDGKQYSAVPYIDAVAVKTDNGVSVFAVNRSDKEVTLEIKAENFECAKNLTHTAMFDDDALACNTFENPERIKPKNIGAITMEDGLIKTTLKPVSWNVIQLG